MISRSRYVSVLRSDSIRSRSSPWVVESVGLITPTSSTNSLKLASSLSPTGRSRLIGCRPISITRRASSIGTPAASAISSDDGSRPSSWSSFLAVVRSLESTSIMCTGIRIVRA
jgi:hypothetical protein